MKKILAAIALSLFSVVAIADVFDALTSKRPYKEPLTLEEALNTMRQGRGTHFDPDLFDAFAALALETAEAAAEFDWVQSADREKILKRLSGQRPEQLPPLNICIQVNIDREAQKAGVLPEDTEALARLCTDLPGLKLRGLMCIPRIGSDEHDPADSYRRTKELFDHLRHSGLEIDTLSMGMSNDLEMAIRHGATIVRIETAIFGARD
mgnify:CR=1 FL=1